LGKAHRSIRKGAELDAHEKFDRVFVVWFLLLSLAVMAQAPYQKKTSTKEDRLSGTVHRVDKDTSTIIVRKGSVQREVVYNAETKFTIQNKPDGSVDDVIVGRRVICLGKFTTRPSYWLPVSRSGRGSQAAWRIELPWRMCRFFGPARTLVKTMINPIRQRRSAYRRHTGE